MPEEKCSAHDRNVSRAEMRRSLKDTVTAGVALFAVIAATTWLCDVWPALSVAMGDPSL